MRCVMLSVLVLVACAGAHEPPTREPKPCNARCYAADGKMWADMKGCSACLPKPEAEPQSEPQSEPQLRELELAQELKQKTPDAPTESDGSALLEQTGILKTDSLWFSYAS
jgi:hypothetical protein